MADNKVNSGLLEFSEDQKVFVALDAETSEVKKAVTIDGDGVETDMLGVQPSGKKEITSTAEVNVANYATAQVVDEDLVAGNIKKDVDILGVVGSYEGGGASDFTTANVSVINNTSNSVSVIAAYITDTPMAGVVPFNSIAGNSNKSYTVPLYKGLCTWSITDGTVSVSVSGDVTYDDGYADITGDCVITISTPAN